MEVNRSTTAITDSPVATEPAAATEQEEFLKLFVAQLQNQDPLSPQDGSAFVAQLAQFASLEQATETNDRLASLEAGQSANIRTQFTDLVGRKVTARTEKMQIPLQTAHGLNLSEAVDELKVEIVSSDGKVVRTLNMGARPAGEVDLSFDGRNDDGAPLADGSYTVRVTAKRDDTPVTVDPYARGVIESLTFAGGQVNFRLGAADLTPGDILKVES